jgi:hypothetical protein
MLYIGRAVNTARNIEHACSCCGSAAAEEARTVACSVTDLMMIHTPWSRLKMITGRPILFNSRLEV